MEFRFPLFSDFVVENVPLLVCVYGLFISILLFLFVEIRASK